MSESLNAGSELDDEISDNDKKILADLQDQEADPTGISEELTEIQSLESHVDDLMYLLGDIRKSHGMTKSFAMEAQRLIPGFDSGTPLGYYTNAPTATRLNVSLEELTNGMMAAIAAIAAAVIAMIWKLYRWLSGTKSDRSSSGAPSSSAAAAALTKTATDIKAVADHSKETLDSLKELPASDVPIPDGKGGHDTESQWTRLILSVGKLHGREKDYEEFFSNPDPFNYDIATNGPFSTLTRKIGKAVPAIVVAMDLRIKLLEKARDIDLSGPFNLNEEMQSKLTLSSVEKSPEIEIDGKKYTLPELAELVTDTRRAAASNTKVKRISFEEYLEGVHKTASDSGYTNFFQVMGHSFAMFDEICKKYEQLNRTLTKPGHSGPDKENSEAIAIGLRKILTLIGKDIAAVTHIVADMKAHSQKQINLQNKLCDVMISFADSFAIERRGAEDLNQVDLTIDKMKGLQTAYKSLFRIR